MHLRGGGDNGTQQRLRALDSMVTEPSALQWPTARGGQGIVSIVVADLDSDGKLM